MLSINITFPENTNIVFTDFDLYSKYYELYTVTQLISFVKNNYPEVYSESFEDEDLELQTAINALNMRITLGNYAKKDKLSPILDFEEYSWVNRLKSKMQEALGVDTISLNYSEDNNFNVTKYGFEQFTSHEGELTEELKDDLKLV